MPVDRVLVVVLGCVALAGCKQQQPEAQAQPAAAVAVSTSADADPSTSAATPPAEPRAEGETGPREADDEPQATDTGETGEPELPVPTLTGLGQPREVDAKIPAKLATCERDWLLAEEPSEAMTKQCVEVFLEYAYFGRPPTDYELDFDPTYSGWIELRYTRPQLERMIALVRRHCPPSNDGVSRCERAMEFLTGMAERKNDLYDDNNVDGIEDPLATILANERLDPSALWLDHGDLGFSELALSKLAAAIDARHGRPFADADLDAFFYSDRPYNWAELDLPALAPNPKYDPAKVVLSAADRHNRALIERAQARNAGEYTDKTYCYVGERVVFSCTLAGGEIISLCGSDDASAAKLDFVVLRSKRGSYLDALPAGLVGDIDEVARFTRADERTQVDIIDEGDFDLPEQRAQITRVELDGDARRYEFTAESETDGEPETRVCSTTTHDELDLVGTSLSAGAKAPGADAKAPGAPDSQPDQTP